MTWTPTIQNCDTYLGERTGKYEWRAVRYVAAGDMMRHTRGLDDSDTVADIGAGMTEFDYCLRTTFDWRGRYFPVDGGLDGTNLNDWTPPREVDWFVALEILEHLDKWRMALRKMQMYARKGIIISTPNPRTTDVLGMDPTHVVAIDKDMLNSMGVRVSEESFYGQSADSLLGVWLNG